MGKFDLVSEESCFGGTMGFYSHESTTNNCPMRFAVYLPPGADKGGKPMLTYLAGLTCTEETFMIKAGAQRYAAEHGLVLLAPDTSPRGEGVPDDPDQAWDFGLGAGFYVDATQSPWSSHYNMYSYVTQELPALVGQHFPVDLSRQGIFGHSMGGHGALTIGLKHREIYRSISAFAPISAPSQCPWGEKALGNYIGNNRDDWKHYDAAELIKQANPEGRSELLVDQGLSDQFLESQLHPHLLEAACETAGYPLTLRRQPGYTHGYFFIQSFIGDHIRHHAQLLHE